MSDTIFTMIVQGKIPSTKVYEDDKVLAFLDINPVNKGHTLVISKEPHPDVLSIPDDLLASVAIAAKKVAQAVKKATKADGINIVQNNGKVSGQEVFHYHVHVIPRFEGDGLKFDWPGKKYNDGEAAEVAQAIKENL